MPRLVKLYITHVAIGFGLSLVFTGAVLALDVGGIGHLVSAVSGGWLAAFVFFMLNGIVFSGVQFGFAIMRMGESDAGGPPRGRALRLAAVPLPAEVRGKVTGPHQP